MKSHTWQVNDTNELATVAQEILAYCKNQLFFVFYGEMGSGKTTLIRTLCTQLGTTDTVASPTYALVNEYQLPADGSPSRIYHMDLYRLKSLEEAYDIGIEDYLTDDNAVFLIEWPDIIEPLLPTHFNKVSIERAPDDTRIINIQVI